MRSYTIPSGKIAFWIFSFTRTWLEVDIDGRFAEFLICFPDFTIRIHFLLFGSYRINEEKDAPPRIRFEFEDGVLNFYSCSVKFIAGALDDTYDWSEDVMSDAWDPRAAQRKLKAQPGLLDQHIFSGSGNIIKNEVLYRTRIHPLSEMGKLPAKQLRLLVAETRNYSFDFLEWKKAYELKKHWLAHTKKTCLRCNLPIIKRHLGKTNRRTFYCGNCQILYAPDAAQ